MIRLALLLYRLIHIDTHRANLPDLIYSCLIEAAFKSVPASSAVISVTVLVYTHYISRAGISLQTGKVFKGIQPEAGVWI